MGKRYFTIFAGRSRYLSILCKYLDLLLQESLIDEVHFWQFTTNHHDLQFMRAKCLAAPTLYKAFPVPNPDAHRWYYFYQYYAQSLADDDLIIKCDDDIVYMEKDMARWRAFLDGVQGDGFYFPNIVNNDVFAMVQQRKGVHTLFPRHQRMQDRALYHSKGHAEPLTDWYMRFDLADMIHRHFLEDPSRYHFQAEELIPYRNRISINFFAVRGAFAKRAFPLVNPRQQEDEMVFGGMPGRPHFPPHHLNLNLTVVHFQFGPQNGQLLDATHLAKYEALADRTTTASICRS